MSLSNLANNFENGLVEERNYWLKRISRDWEVVTLTPDYSGEDAVSNINIKDRPLLIDQNLQQKLSNITGDRDFLLYTVMLAALNLCLHKYTGKDQIILGSPALQEENKIVNNTIPIITNIDRELSFRDFLVKLRQSLLEDYQRQEYPLERIIDDLGISASVEENPFFDIVLILTNIHQVEHWELKNNLTIEITKDAGEVRGHLKYNANLYSQDKIDRFINHYRYVLENALENINTDLANLSIFSPAEQDLILVKWNDTTVDYPKAQLVHQLFTEQAQRTPEATAVVFGDNTLTYRELNEKSNQLAGHLQEMGLKPNELVGICMEPCLEMIIGLFGILKAGGAYVPIDSNYPQERIGWMLQDANPSLIISKKHLIDKYTGLDLKILYIDDDGKQIEDYNKDDVTVDDLNPRNMAYIIYTSGSTGKPKGAAVYQQGWTNLLHWFISEFQLNPDDKVLLISSFSFDLTQKNLFAPLIAGGQLHLLESGYYDPELILNEINTKGITLLNCTPSAFYPLLESCDNKTLNRLASLRCLFLGGEPISVTRLKKWVKSEFFNCEVINTYGPTECTDICCFHRLTREDLSEEKPVPIGKPIFNTNLYILNSQNEPAPIGIPGELCIAGDGIGAGYLNDQALTSEKFISNPFAKDPSSILYKTGDLACYDSDGIIHYIGRIDHQVKIRGFRIEPGEIEATINSHPIIEEAIVLVKESSFGDKKLVACLIPDQQRAFFIKQLLKLQPDEVSNNRLYRLPNGMRVFHLNKSETDFVYREIFEERTYFQEGITLDDGDTILDVGANIGLFSLFAGSVKKNLNIYAFEPIPPIFETLEKNMKLYNVPARLYNYGLSDADKEEEITYYPYVSIMSGKYADYHEDHENIKLAILHEQSEAGNKTKLSEEEIDGLVAERLQKEVFKCQFKTISQFIKEQRLEKVDLLKIDVEKSELDILNGIDAGDWKKIKQIVLEIHDIGGRLEQVRLLLESHGYQIAYLKDTRLEDNEIYNLYAVAAEKGMKKGNNTLSLRFDPTGAESDLQELIKDVKHYLQERLPVYMMPSEFVVIDSFPLTPNGKVDREALLRYCDEQAPTKGGLAVPTTEAEEVIAKIWAEVLDVEKIGIDDNFIELGGHSLLATAIISRLRKLFSIELSIQLFFENPTVRMLAAVVDDLRSN